MKTQRLQAAFARRREAEHMRIEKTEAVNRYYDHWGKVTSRFESWTTPAYYEQAEESTRKRRENQEKEIRLQQRRKKLKDLFEEERKLFDEEVHFQRKPKPRCVPTDVLEKIDKALKERSEERKRLEVESKLYSRWRHGVIDDGASLYESKTSNQALAKLNWLDKQIENQMVREQELKETELRTLRLKEEARKREEQLKERQKIRESEIKELRAIQENHMQELKRREAENSFRHEEETHLRNAIEQLEHELTWLDSRKPQSISQAGVPYNIKRIKMIIRKRSEIYRQELKEDIDLLKRISIYCTDEHIKHFIEKLELNYDLEISKQSQIETMYESEAKHNLAKWNELWNSEYLARESQLSYILKKQKSIFEAKLAENIKQQKHLIEIQEKHLAAIENSNEKLKLLIKEQESSQEMLEQCQEIESKATEKYSNDAADSAADNLSRCDIRSDTPSSGPKFARKKVAWT